MAAPVRRVVTGKDGTGKAIAMIDAVATSVHRREAVGVTNTLLWVTDSNPPDLSNREDAANKEIGVVKLGEGLRAHAHHEAGHQGDEEGHPPPASVKERSEGAPDGPERRDSGTATVGRCASSIGHTSQPSHGGGFSALRRPETSRPLQPKRFSPTARHPKLRSRSLVRSRIEGLRGAGNGAGETLRRGFESRREHLKRSASATF